MSSISNLDGRESLEIAVTLQLLKYLNDRKAFSDFARVLQI